MKIQLPTSKLSLQTARFLTMLFLLLCLPLTSYASRLIYTIQTGSFLHAADARKQFNSMVQRLNETELDYLRIEKIGKFYSVRLGKFEKRYEAEKFLRTIQQQPATFLLMKAYDKKERIERLYKTRASEVPQAGDEELTEPPFVKIKPQAAKVDEKKYGKPVEEQIKTISNPVENKEYEEALEMLKKELAVRPQDPEINSRYGTMLFKLKKPAEAIEYLRKAVELSPGVSDYHNRIGYCLILLSKFNEAIDEFKKAVTINPLHVGALAGLGVSYSELGEKEKAMDAYDKLKNLDRVLSEIVLQIIEET